MEYIVRDYRKDLEEEERDVELMQQIILRHEQNLRGEGEDDENTEETQYISAW